MWTRVFAHMGLGVFVAVVCLGILLAAQKWLPAVVVRIIAIAIIVFGILSIGVGIGAWFGI